jgi:CheY-like chemotaxis protein
MIRRGDDEPGAPRIDGAPLVLIVDDDSDSRETARMVLEEEGYRVDVAANGHLALERLRSLPAPAVILVDLMMPVMDGPSLIEELEASSTHGGIPVVVMTASGPDTRTSGLRYPVLRKPFSLDALVRIVSECAPRLWDEEAPTDETRRPSDRAAAESTAKVRCAKCDLPASARCVRCGEGFCRNCLDAGPSGLCSSCRRERPQP